jgi:hypothetical protein
MTEALFLWRCCVVMAISAKASPVFFLAAI